MESVQPESLFTLTIIVAMSLVVLVYVFLRMAGSSEETTGVAGLRLRSPDQRR